MILHMIRNARVDRNQPEIVKALRKAGAVVKITSQLKDAFDLLVGHRGRLMMVEVKDGDKPPSARRLTPGEQKCKDAFSTVDVNYFIVNNIEEALELLK